MDGRPPASDPERVPDHERVSVDDLDVDPRGARAYTTVGIVFAALALVLVPFVTGPLGMAFGTIGHVKRDPWGIKVAVAGGVTMLIGMALQALLFGSGGVAA